MHLYTFTCKQTVCITFFNLHEIIVYVLFGNLCVSFLKCTYLFINIWFIFSWAGFLLLHTCVPCLWWAGAPLWLPCRGFSLPGPLLSPSTGSKVHRRHFCDTRPSSCDAQAWLLPGMWDLPGSGVKPMFGGFLTTVSPGKSGNCYISITYVLLIFLSVHTGPPHFS